MIVWTSQNSGSFLRKPLSWSNHEYYILFCPWTFLLINVPVLQLSCYYSSVNPVIWMKLLECVSIYIFHYFLTTIISCFLLILPILFFNINIYIYYKTKNIRENKNKNCNFPFSYWVVIEECCINEIPHFTLRQIPVTSVRCLLMCRSFNIHTKTTDYKIANK